MSKMLSDLLDLSKPLPFEHLFASLVQDARVRLCHRATATQIALLRDQAHAGWERYLLRRLCGAGAQAADCQFQAFRTVRSVFGVTKTGGRRPADGLYQQFVGDSPEKQLRKLFQEFPALAEYCEMFVSNWVDTVTEFLIRLEEDRDLLDDHFAARRFSFPVPELQAGLSDPHHGGRCVVRLTFENGTSLIYKPRSIAPEAHFSELLKSFNARVIPHRFKTTRCWDRTRYGWMEDVKPHPCKTLAEVHAFYWRAGALLALVYLARGVDMHRENLIAAGEFPVLIDLESLWHPQEHAGNTDSAIEASVLRTGFLPQNNPQLGAIYEWNAFGHRLDLDLPITVWTFVNQDNMGRERANRPYRAAHHLPIFLGTEHLARDFLPDILDGFRWLGGQVLENNSNRQKFQGWIKTLVQCPRRRILRSSLWYQAVLEQLIAPNSLRKKNVAPPNVPQFVLNGGPLVEDEWRALKQLDIPWLEQTVAGESDFPPLLPVHTMKKFLAQESLISDALAPLANQSNRSPASHQTHQGG